MKQQVGLDLSRKDTQFGWFRRLAGCPLRAARNGVTASQWISTVRISPGQEPASFIKLMAVGGWLSLTCQ